MPEVKNYDGKKKHGSHSTNGHAHKKHENHKAHAKRRPHHESEHLEDEVNTEALNDEATAAAAEHTHHSENHENTETTYQAHDADESTDGHKKIHLEFYGSEMIRQKAPKVMELADTVAEEWVNDGQFEGLPVGNPLAQVAAAKALRKAKDVEKKLEEKGVFAMAKMGLDYVKAEIEKRKR
jgi:hypothetical protein